MDIYSQAKQKLKITHFNEMQEEAFEVIPQGHDTLLLSLTGSGKTLAFLLPLMKQLDHSSNHLQFLIITPTRELALQINSVASSLATGVNLTCCYGGHPIRFEKKALSTNPSIVIGTPGRILDHLERGNINPLNLRFLVLDEFDKTLEMGFHKQMESIIQFLKYKPQYILTSATRALELPAFLPILNPKEIDFVQNNKVEGLTFWKVKSDTKDKLPVLISLIKSIGNDSTFVFVNFRESAERISESLDANSIENDVFHGGLDQVQRENILSKFRNGSTRILVTTDLAGRGLDIPQVENIVHYHLPMDEDTFTHRNGRTARMEQTGNIFIIVTEQESEVSFIKQYENYFKITEPSGDLTNTSWTTIRISKGKRDKLRKVDVVGFLFKIGGLDKDELGLVEVKESYSLAAIQSRKVDVVIKKTNGQKVKGKKTLVAEL